MDTTNITIVRGKQQIGVWSLPNHNDKVQDTDGSVWTVKMNGGVMLRANGACHPAFTSGPMDAWQFASWINEAFA